MNRLKKISKFKCKSSIFTKHLDETNETYTQHFLFTLNYGARLIFIGVILVLHGIFPFIFTTFDSKSIIKIANIFIKRSAHETKNTDL